MIQISDMNAFVAVVEMASFTEAARRLGTTKSVISRRISDLEQELGAALLDRNARSVRATEVGAVYYAKCVRILESIGAANDFVTGFNSLVKGRLRVAVPEAFGASPVSYTHLDVYKRQRFARGPAAAGHTEAGIIQVLATTRPAAFPAQFRHVCGTGLRNAFAACATGRPCTPVGAALQG